MKYINKTLTIEKINLQKIAKKFGTPFYSYSYYKLKENINKETHIFFISSGGECSIISYPTPLP